MSAQYDKKDYFRYVDKGKVQRLEQVTKNQGERIEALSLAVRYLLSDKSGEDAETMRMLVEAFRPVCKDVGPIVNEHSPKHVQTRKPSVEEFTTLSPGVKPTMKVRQISSEEMNEAMDKFETFDPNEGND